jgi:C1A family cysteine protease
VKDQGLAGTCWAFGALASLESRVSLVDNQVYDFSEQNLITGVDPALAYIAYDRRYSGGNALVSADTLSKNGVRLESTQPYNPATAEY